MGLDVEEMCHVLNITVVVGVSFVFFRPILWASYLRSIRCADNRA